MILSAPITLYITIHIGSNQLILPFLPPKGIVKTNKSFYSQSNKLIKQSLKLPSMMT